MINFPLIITLYAGFTHAFETDHFLAVSNIVTSRNKTTKAVKDGLFWGLGHTSTIFLIGILILLLKWNIEEKYYSWFEAIVGLMLLLLGIFRIKKWYKEKSPVMHTHIHAHTTGQAHAHIHLHTVDKPGHQHSHLPAYNIGLVYGLAGSGSLIMLAMSQSQSVTSGLLYLLLFSLGSIAGMMLAAGVFSLPFSQKLLANRLLRASLVFLSSVLCILYGGLIIYQNIF